MLESILFSLNVVLPIFIMIFLGWLAIRVKLIDRPTMNRVGAITFRYFLSCRIFLDIAESGTRFDQESPVAVFSFFAILINIAVIWILAHLLVRPKESIGAFIHVSFRTSFTILGLSMVRNMAGEAGVAKAALLLVMIIVVFNVLSVVALTDFKKSQNIGGIIRSTLYNIVTNPLIIAALLGLVFSHFQLRLPTLVNKPLHYLSDMAVPLSLLCIGSVLDFQTVRDKWKNALTAALIKTFGTALLVIPIALLVGFRGIELGIIAILFTTANPSAAYVMTAAMGGDAELAATSVVLSTLFSVFSTTIALFALRALGFL